MKFVMMTAAALVAAGLYVPSASAASISMCAASDVVLNGSTASACQWVEGDTNDATSGAAATWDINTFGLHGGGWAETGKSEDLDDPNDDIAEPGSVGPFTFLTDLEPTGSFTMSWASLPTDPFSVDLAVVLKASTGWKAYLFDDFTFTGVGPYEGIFNTPFFNNRGARQALSHMSIYLRAGSSDDGGTDGGDGGEDGDHDGDVPEPAALALFGLGLLGASYARRRRS